MMDDAVCMDGVSFGYGPWPILEDVHLRVSSGEYACILGPNGGGKTTLFKLILGLNTPKKGRVLLLGKPPKEVRVKVGYMPQSIEFDSQIPVTVKEVVLMGRLGVSKKWRYPEEDSKKAELSLRFLELENLKGFFFKDLSGGQKQRVLLARALSCEPQVLLLDEPTANIDPEGGRLLAERLAELKGKVTLLVITHDLGFVPKDVDRVFCVNRYIVEHPTSDLESSLIPNFYKEPVKLVRHDIVLGKSDG
jgi:zinc transport system ATP-binding protein